MSTLTDDPASYPPSELDKGITGTCLCGSVSVTITQPGLFSKPNGHVCRCANCRKATGAITANVLMLPAQNVQVSDPKSYLKTYADSDTGSGGTIKRSFCPNCGSLFGGIPAKDSGEQYACLSLGIFPRIPKPEFELFTAHRHEWLKPISGAEQYQFSDELENC